MKNREFKEYICIDNSYYYLDKWYKNSDYIIGEKYITRYDFKGGRYIFSFEERTKKGLPPKGLTIEFFEKNFITLEKYRENKINSIID